MSAKPPLPRKDSGPSALFVIEEAMHLLRTAPAGDLCWYYAGGVPWVLGLLGFWSHATWFAPTGPQLAWGALLLSGLFGWLKFCQAMFAGRLLARRRGVELPVLSWRDGLACLLRQLRLHTWGLFVLPVAALLTAPMAYVWTYYQTLTVTEGVEYEVAEGARRRADGSGAEAVALLERPWVGGDAWKLAKLWPMQTHVGMMILCLLILVGWLNLAGAFLLLPFLATRFFGMENLFGLSDWAMFNTTFFASTVASAWLAADPLFKAYHVVRCFHGRALSDGEDLREAFAGSQAKRVLSVLAMLVVLGAGAGQLRAKEPVSALSESGSLSAGNSLQAPAGGASPAQGQRLEPSPTPQRVESQALQRAIEEKLQDSDFAWRLRAKPALEKDRPESALVRFIKVGVETVREIIEAVQERYQRLKRWWKRLWGGEEEEDAQSQGKPAGSSEILFNLFTYVLGALLLLVLAYLCYVVARQARRNARRHVFARPNFSPLAKPDLSDETVHAAQLPSEGWLDLAREKLGRGEWRLAFRALYLAQLAKFGEQGFLSLARHKTNQDYELELRRRQPQRGALLESFGRRRRGFDAVWYGRAQAGETEIRDWLAELERRESP